MRLSLFCAVFLALFGSLPAQVRVAVLPIRNMDGNLSLNTYCYSIADSLRAELSRSEHHGHQFVIVPADSVEAVLAELNLDPSNMQYTSDMWKSVAMLNCQYAVTGTFNVNGGRMLLNVYCYNVATKIADRTNAAVNIFKAPEKIFDMIPAACQKLIPAFKAP